MLLSSRPQDKERGDVQRPTEGWSFRPPKQLSGGGGLATLSEDNHDVMFARLQRLECNLLLLSDMVRRCRGVADRGWVGELLRISDDALVGGVDAMDCTPGLDEESLRIV